MRSWVGIIARDFVAPRHRADADLETPSRRWLGASTPSSRRSYGDNIASMARPPEIRCPRRRGARVGMWQDFQDDKKRSANVKRQRTAVNFKREEKQETKKKYGEWDRESWRRDWK